MKQTLHFLNCLITLFLITGNTGYAQLPAYVPAGSLIAYYDFAGNANDLSGNGIHGTVSGPTYTSDRFGNANAAVRYMGTNERITTSKIDRVYKSSISYSVWVKPINSATLPTEGTNTALGSASSYSCIVAAVNGWNWSTTSTDMGVGLNVSTNGVSVSEHAPGVTKAALVWSGTLTGWHHIVVVYNSNSPSLYIDGVF